MAGLQGDYFSPRKLPASSVVLGHPPSPLHFASVVLAGGTTGGSRRVCESSADLGGDLVSLSTFLPGGKWGRGIRDEEWGGASRR